MFLTEEEKAMLAGDFGTPTRMAMESQVAVGEFFGAERLVRVDSVHVMGDWDSMAAAGHEFLEQLVLDGGKVRVSTTRNPRPVDFRYAVRFRQSSEFVLGEQLVSATFIALGVAPVHTCIIYQSVYQP